jgi:hypothetical protein
MEIINRFKNYKADWIDVALTKIAVFTAALFIAKLWNPILDLDWYWYLIIWVLAAVKPIVTFLRWIILSVSK